MAYTVSQDFKDHIKDETALKSCLILFDDLFFSTADFTDSGVVFNQFFNTSEDLTFGDCPSDTLSFAVIANGKLGGYSFGKCRAYIGVQTASESYAFGDINAHIEVGGYTWTASETGLYCDGTLIDSDEYVSLVSDGTKVYAVGTSSSYRANIDGSDGAEYLPHAFMAQKLRSGLSAVFEANTAQVWDGENVITIEYVPMGQYNVVKPRSTVGDIVEIQDAYDNMTLFDADASQFLESLTYPVTLSGIYTALCDFVGVEYVTDTFLYSDTSYASSPFADTSCSLRDILWWIAERARAVAHFNRVGSLSLIGVNFLPPKEYQAVEWISSSSDGHQYIDTGIKANQNSGVDITYYAESAIGGSGYGAIFGARQSSANKELQLTTYSSNLSLFSGTLRFSNSSYNAGITTFNKQTFKLRNKTYTTPSGVTGDLTAPDFETPANIVLFALNENGNIIQWGKSRIYEYKFYQGDTLIQWLVPCYRKSDNEIGMYDICSGEFLTNAGTGTFTKGDDINAIYGVETLTASDIGQDGYSVAEYKTPDVTGVLLRSGNGTTLSFGSMTAPYMISANPFVSTITNEDLEAYESIPTYIPMELMVLEADPSVDIGDMIDVRPMVDEILALTNVYDEVYSEDDEALSIEAPTYQIPLMNRTLTFMGGIRASYIATGNEIREADLSNTEYNASVAPVTQTDVFNRLTNNGASQGIYLEDGKIYINAEYIKAGTLQGIRVVAEQGEIGGMLLSSDGISTWAITPYYDPQGYRKYYISRIRPYGLGNTSLDDYFIGINYSNSIESYNDYQFGVTYKGDVVCNSLNVKGAVDTSDRIAVMGSANNYVIIRPTGTIEVQGYSGKKAILTEDGLRLYLPGSTTADKSFIL